MENKVVNPETMKRGDFLRNLGLSTSALMAFYCMGTLTSCSKSDDPTPANSNPGTGTAGFTGNAESGKGKIDFTLDLTSATYGNLKSQGNFTKIGDVLIANAKGSRFIAVSKTCTHEGGGLSYRVGSDDLLCDNHGGQFNADGSVKLAPPTKALKTFKTETTNNGNTLRVTE